MKALRQLIGKIMSNLLGNDLAMAPKNRNKSPSHQKRPSYYPYHIGESFFI